ncbi:MAG: SH3 domain-containing protein, partial [Deltaproteobacteria bacterium]|nr:SH3 domain-containing protein [Deltaproteobacteria bacterium]
MRRPYSEEDISDSTSPLPSHKKVEVSDVPKPSTSDQEKEVAEVPEPLPSVKAESWYVLLRRMNIRQNPSTDGKIARKLNKNAEFQIIEEAPDNNPSNAWYLIRTRSGFSGWLCGIYAGNIKYKELSQPDLLQKEITADLARAPYSEEEISDVPKPLPSDQEEE